MHTYLRTFDNLKNVQYNYVVKSNAPVVKWISHRSSEPLLGVRIPPGAQ